MMYVAVEEGQGLVEYGLLLALVVGVAIVALALFAPELIKIFQGIVDKLSTVSVASPIR